jgi:hypothetical protein
LELSIINLEKIKDQKRQNQFDVRGDSMLGKRINSDRQLTVPGSYGRSIDVKKGQYVAVRDIEGGQGITDLEIIVADSEEEIMRT